MIKLLLVFACIIIMELDAKPHGHLNNEIPEGLLNTDSLSDDYPLYYHKAYPRRSWGTNRKRWFPIKEYRGGLMEV
uniref:Uncharacterized protein n=1 Tax=Trichobilharzia regenti TaxID=157069 RepID=A0AA85K4K5_TRIRE|nr:unnamed protein product [Trichobilharzia regenti]